MGQDVQKEFQHDLFGHVMPLTQASTSSSMAPLHVLSQDNKNEVQHEFIGHVIPLMLALALCDADDVVNGIIVFASKMIKMGCNMTLWLM